jgi:hypothetical protein
LAGVKAARGERRAASRTFLRHWQQQPNEHADDGDDDDQLDAGQTGEAVVPSLPADVDTGRKPFQTEQFAK